MARSGRGRCVGVRFFATKVAPRQVNNGMSLAQMLLSLHMAVAVAVAVAAQAAGPGARASESPGARARAAPTIAARGNGVYVDGAPYFPVGYCNHAHLQAGGHRSYDEEVRNGFTSIFTCAHWAWRAWPPARCPHGPGSRTCILVAVPCRWTTHAKRTSIH